MSRFLPAAFAIAGLSSPAFAQEELRPFCSTRPSLGTSACIMDVGHVMAEVGIGLWELDRDAKERADSFLFGDALLRLGVGETTEVQLGWTALGHQRTRDRATGVVDRRTRTGDVTVAIRQNLRNPDGSGFSYGVQPFVTLPLGGDPIGSGSWGAGMVAPVSYDLSEAVNVQFTGEVDAAPDEDGDGRHFAYSGIWGAGLSLSDAVAITGELSITRDRDPEEHATMSLAALSLAWQPAAELQLDMGGVAGLNASSPDVQVYFGISRRF